MQMGRTKDAIAVLEHAMKLGTDPGQIALIQSQVESIQQYQAARERADRDYRDASQQSQPGDQSAQPPEPTSPQAADHPEDDRHGPRRTIKGTLRHVQCSSPSTMTLKVENAAKPVDLRTRNYYKVQYSALNFTPTGELNPCKDLEGMKSKIEYFEAVDGSAEGQIVSIELTK